MKTRHGLLCFSVFGFLLLLLLAAPVSHALTIDPLPPVNYVNILMTGATVAEGDSGVGTAHGSLRLDWYIVTGSDPAYSFHVDWQTLDIGEATPGTDYLATSGTLTQLMLDGVEGTAEFLLPVDIFGDTDVEPDESFLIAIEAAGFGIPRPGSGVEISVLSDTGLMTIANDDGIADDGAGPGPGTGPGPAPIPEPASALLLGIGLAGLCWKVRSKRDL